MVYTIEDTILAASRELEPFQHVRLITTKGYFLEQIIDKIPAEILLKTNNIPTCNYAHLIADSNLEVTEFVDFTTEPITVCINVDMIQDHHSMIAAEMIATAVVINGEASGRVDLGNPMRYVVSDLNHLINWH